MMMFLTGVIAKQSSAKQSELDWRAVIPDNGWTFVAIHDDGSGHFGSIVRVDAGVDMCSVTIPDEGATTKYREACRC